MPLGELLAFAPTTYLTPSLTSSKHLFTPLIFTLICHIPFFGYFLFGLENKLLNWKACLPILLWTQRGHNSDPQSPPCLPDLADDAVLMLSLVTPLHVSQNFFFNKSYWLMSKNCAVGVEMNVSRPLTSIGSCQYQVLVSSCYQPYFSVSAQYQH